MTPFSFQNKWHRQFVIGLLALAIFLFTVLLARFWNGYPQLNPWFRGLLYGLPGGLAVMSLIDTRNSGTIVAGQERPPYYRQALLIKFIYLGGILFIILILFTRKITFV